MKGKARSQAWVRYQRRFWPVILTYAVVLVAVIRVFHTHPPSGPIKYVLAVAPALPLVGVILVLGLYLLEEADEFRRLQVVLSMLAGLGITLAATTAWGFLEVLAGARHVPMYWVFPIFCASMGISQPIIAWRYR